MAEKKELKLTKKQETRVEEQAEVLKLDKPVFIERLELALEKHQISIDEALEEVQKSIDDPGREMPWYEKPNDPAEAGDEEGEKKTMLDQLAEELEMPPEDLKAKLEGMQVTANLSLEGAEEGDVTTLLGLVAKTQEDHETLKADFDHLLTWAHRRGYIKE